MSISKLAPTSGHRVEVASNIPGRLRVRLHSDSRQPSVMNRIKEHLAGRDGIYGISLNRNIGSVRVDYDHQRHKATEIFELLKDVDVIAENLTDAPHVDEQDGAALTFSDAIEDLNKRLFYVLPVAFAGAGLGSIVKNGLMVESVSRWLLLWFAFGTFIKLHPGTEAAMIQACASIW